MVTEAPRTDAKPSHGRTSARRSDRLQILREYVNETLVGVLHDPVVVDGNPHDTLRELGQLAALEADESNGRNAALVRIFAGPDDVGRVAARAHEENGVARPEVVTKLLGEDLL